MQKNKVIVSIILVHYRIKKELFDCIQSIYDGKNKVSFEIIVVDNDENKTIEKELKKKFPEVQYIKNPVNNGWGSGTNLGVAHAHGEYLYFLNPDTIVFPKAIDSNYEFIKSHPKTGVVSSLLLDKNKKPYVMQGSKELTLSRALVVFSFLNTRFPHNPISQTFWCLNQKRENPFIIETPILSASLIHKKTFEKIGMFDPHYFLYFEEYDLGKRLSKGGYKNYINTDSKVIHFWEGSTKFRDDRNEIMRRSRFYFFRKYYGSIIARLLDIWLMLPFYVKTIIYGRIVS